MRAADALLIGTVFHVGTAEVYWNARKDGKDLTIAMAMAMEATRAESKRRELDRYLQAKNQVMASAYCTAWNLRPDVKCIAVEVPFELPLIWKGKTSEFWRRAGKMDAILQLEDGRVALCEHKTCAQDSGPGSDYRRRLTMDEQISIYFDAAHAIGYAPDMILYDVVHKPQQRPKSASPVGTRYKKDGGLKANCREADETPEEFFERVLSEQTAKGLTSTVDWIEVYRHDAQRKQFGKILVDQARFMRWSIENNIHPPNSDQCFAYRGSACPFVQVCEGTARLEDPAMFYIPKTMHPELEDTKDDGE